MDLGPLAPDGRLLLAATALDLAFGDPVYAWHPVRLMGRTLEWMEARLRAAGLDGYGGGCLLFVGLALVWCAAPCLIAWKATWVWHLFLLYSLLALRDLLTHALRVERAIDVFDARKAIAMLVGRDTDCMDHAGCRRAAIESLSENLTDGFLSPVFWYALAGLPGLLAFKIASTMDSMVGYKTPRYLKFGWCGARLDDVLNFVPARMSWLLLSLVALLLPGCSLAKALRVGWRQHALVPGPNSGWSEATAAGALQRRLIGPIWARGELVTEVWLGDAEDPPGGERGDVVRACWLVSASGMVFVLCAAAWVWR